MPPGIPDIGIGRRGHNVSGLIRFALAFLLWSQAASAADPAAKPARETVDAFQKYVRYVTESGLDARLQDADAFLWADTAERRSQVRAKGVMCEPRSAKGDRPVEGGLIHDWVGSAFIPGASVADVLELLQDYDTHKVTYQPEVIASQTLERKGNDFKVRLRLLKRKFSVKVVLDTDYDIHYQPLGAHDWQARAYSTRIVQIANAGTPQEREVPPGHDNGFLWRLYSYWLFRERDGGAYVECEAVSLSRGVPAILAWLINPIVRELPKEALYNTLAATRNRLLRGAAGRAPR